MKTCSLNDFMEELKPWLDKEHIRDVQLDGENKFVVHFLDGMKNVYTIDDCNKDQIDTVIKDLRKKGIPIN